jgi:hypothetical protein
MNQALVTDPVNDENNIAIPKYWPATDGEYFWA